MKRPTRYDARLRVHVPVMPAAWVRGAMRMRRPTRWPAAEVDALVAAREGGASLRTLATRFGRSHQRIQTLLIKAALEAWAISEPDDG